MADSEERTDERRLNHEGSPCPVSTRIREAPVPIRYVFVPKSDQCESKDKGG